MKLSSYLKLEGLSQQKFCLENKISLASLNKHKKGGAQQGAFLRQIAEATKHNVTRFSELLMQEDNERVVTISKETLLLLIERHQECQDILDIYERMPEDNRFLVVKIQVEKSVCE